MVLPIVVAVALGLAWLLALASTQIRVVDAAREVARATAREDSSALALGRRVAPHGSRITVREKGALVTVHVSTAVHGPRGLLGFLPGVEVEADAVAAREQR